MSNARLRCVRRPAPRCRRLSPLRAQPHPAASTNTDARTAKHHQRHERHRIPVSFVIFHATLRGRAACWLCEPSCKRRGAGSIVFCVLATVLRRRVSRSHSTEPSGAVTAAPAHAHRRGSRRRLSPRRCGSPRARRARASAGSSAPARRPPSPVRQQKKRDIADDLRARRIEFRRLHQRQRARQRRRPHAGAHNRGRRAPSASVGASLRRLLQLLAARAEVALSARDQTEPAMPAASRQRRL